MRKFVYTAGLICISVNITACATNAVAVSPQLYNTKFKLETQNVNSQKVLTTLIDTQPPPAFNGNPYDIAGLNWSIQPLMFDYLCDYSPFPEKSFRESLLESYKLEENILTMKLRKDIKWSDGSPITIEDVITNYYMQVGRGDFWSYADAINILDNNTIQIKYITESPLLLNISFAYPITSPVEQYKDFAIQYKEIIDQHRALNSATNTYYLTKEGNEILANVNKEMLSYKPNPTEVLCSGPYIIKSTTTSEITFIKNPHYYMQLPFEAIRGLRGGSSEAFATSILEEQYSLENGGLSPDMSIKIENLYRDTLRKVYVPELSQIGYTFNYNNYPLNIPEVRKALCHATNREVLLYVAERGSFLSDTKNSGLIPSMVKMYADEEFYHTLTDYNYDLEQAQNLLYSIGWSKNEHCSLKPSPPHHSSPVRC
ncbi:MAG: hypothetical protein ATN36_00850 [Epulopiscium sp. Nele67-Bin005]|nr:MAG: hypothetical protein ATN36_00850 [Epulopiscium sp. Nele67-Bin005]